MLLVTRREARLDGRSPTAFVGRGVLLLWYVSQSICGDSGRALPAGVLWLLLELR